jgi:uncharacterized protein (DUF983 family)
MLISDIFYSVFANKCPRCHQGKVLSSSNPFQISKILDTENTCSHCGLKYEKEPGFYYGAMYVSYGLTSGIFIVMFILELTVFNMETTPFAIMMLSIILLTFPFVTRWARVLWLNFFFRYKPELDNKGDQEKGDQH